MEYLNTSTLCRDRVTTPHLGEFQWTPSPIPTSDDRILCAPDLASGIAEARRTIAELSEHRALLLQLTQKLSATVDRQRETIRELMGTIRRLRGAA